MPNRRTSFAAYGRVYITSGPLSNGPLSFVVPPPDARPPPTYRAMIRCTAYCMTTALLPGLQSFFAPRATTKGRNNYCSNFRPIRTHRHLLLPGRSYRLACGTGPLDVDRLPPVCCPSTIWRGGMRGGAGHWPLRPNVHTSSWPHAPQPVQKRVPAPPHLVARTGNPRCGRPCLALCASFAFLILTLPCRLRRLVSPDVSATIPMCCRMSGLYRALSLRGCL